MNERGGLEAVIGALVRHVPPRDLMQFAFDERDQLFKGKFIAKTPLAQQLGDPGRLLRNAKF